MKNFLLLFLFLNAVVFGQQVQPNLSTPKNALYTHIYFLQEDSFEPEKAGLVFKYVQGEDAQELAIKLKKIYDGKGLKLDFSKIPDIADYKDTIKEALTGFVKVEKKYFPFPKELPLVYLENSGSEWYYSEVTTNVIESLYNEIFIYDFTYLERKFPSIFSKSFRGVAIWKPIVLFVLIGLSILFFFLLRFILRRVFRYLNKLIFKENVLPESGEYINSITRPLVFIIIIEFLKGVIPSVELLKLNTLLFLLLNIAETVFWVFFLIRLLRFVVANFNNSSYRSDSKMQEQLSPIIIKIINSFIIFLGFLRLLTLFGVEPTTVLAGASIGGIAVAFAAQDSVKNLIGTIVIFLDKPFQIGDWVEIGSISGTVEKVGLRSTVIRAADTSVFQIPNSKISEIEINNKGLRIYRRYQTELGIRYDTPPELIEGFVRGVREIVKEHPDTRDESYNVEFTGFGDSALLILVNVYFKHLDWGAEQSSKHRLHMAIVKLAKSLGVEFAFPSSTLIIEQFPEKTGFDLKYNTNKEFIDKQIQSNLVDFKNYMSTQEENIHARSEQ